MDLILTLRCNNKCIFCPRKEYLSLLSPGSEKEIVKEILNIRKNSHQIVLSGGEATLYKTIGKVLRICRNLKFDTISLVSNGRTLSMDNVVRLNKMGVKDLAISIYSHKKSAHEKVTREHGSHKETIRGIKNAIAVSKFTNLSLRLNIVLNIWNYGHITDTIEFFRRLGINNFIVAEQLIIEKGSKHLGLNQIKSSIEKIKRIKAPGMNICLKGFSPCLIFRRILKNKNNKIARLIKDSGRYPLKAHAPAIEWEILNFDTAKSNGRGAGLYRKKINSLFLKTEMCTSCSINRICPGFQKAYINDEE